LYDWGFVCGFGMLFSALDLNFKLEK